MPLACFGPLFGTTFGLKSRDVLWVTTAPTNLSINMVLEIVFFGFGTDLGMILDPFRAVFAPS